MTWRNRIFTEIKLTSPAGTIYSAKWQGGSRDTEKSLGVFKAPGIGGSIVQDLDRAAVTYGLTLFFDGPEHDITADRFFQECGSTRGVWDVIHPVKGRLKLQLVSYSEAIEPVSNSNITTVTTEWIEPRLPAISISSERARAQTKTSIQAFNEVGGLQFTKELILVTFENISRVITATTRMVDTYNQTLRTLVDQTVGVKNQIDVIQAQIFNTINATVINADVLSGQIVNMIQIPAQVAENVQESTALYYNFINQLLSINSEFKIDPNVLDEISINDALINELTVISSLGAISDIIVSGELITRRQTLNIIDESNNNFFGIVNNLDEYQEKFLGEYFSQSESYNSSIEMISQTHRYLIISAFDLKIEKRITLDRPKSPVFVTIEQYGDLGENDENLDFFLSSNTLKANDIMLLQSGREVLVYL
jgi:hypothetical protein